MAPKKKASGKSAVQGPSSPSVAPASLSTGSGASSSSRELTSSPVRTDSQDKTTPTASVSVVDTLLRVEDAMVTPVVLLRSPVAPPSHSRGDSSTDLSPRAGPGGSHKAAKAVDAVRASPPLSASSPRDAKQLPGSDEFYAALASTAFAPFPHEKRDCYVVILDSAADGDFERALHRPWALTSVSENFISIAEDDLLPAFLGGVYHGTVGKPKSATVTSLPEACRGGASRFGPSLPALRRCEYDVALASGGRTCVEVVFINFFVFGLHGDWSPSGPAFRDPAALPSTAVANIGFNWVNDVVKGLRVLSRTVSDPWAVCCVLFARARFRGMFFYASDACFLLLHCLISTTRIMAAAWSESISLLLSLSLSLELPCRASCLPGRIPTVRIMFSGPLPLQPSV